MFDSWGAGSDRLESFDFWKTQCVGVSATGKAEDDSGFGMNECRCPVKDRPAIDGKNSTQFIP